MAEYVKLVDISKCTGCKACMVACKNWNDLPAEREEFQGSVQSHKQMTANTWNVVTFTEHVDEKGNLDWFFRHSACMHCTDAACVKVCPEDAMHHTDFGSVVIDRDLCVGCGYCVSNCPFDVVQLATFKDKNGKEYRKAQKCTLCTDRLEKNLQPACSNACPTDAIQFGEKDAMLQMASKRLEQIKQEYPNANIYNPASIDGTHNVYILTEKPSVFGLPDAPKVPLSATLWKDYAQPASKLLVGVTMTGVIGAFIANSLFNKPNQHDIDDLGKGGTTNGEQ